MVVFWGTTDFMHNNNTLEGISPQMFQYTGRQTEHGYDELSTGTNKDAQTL